MSRPEEFARLEALGESEVRYQLAQFRYSGSTQLAEEWLRQKEAARLAVVEAKALATAKSAAEAANLAASAALLQARWAKWAALIAAIAAVISAKDEIIHAIKHLP